MGWKDPIKWASKHTALKQHGTSSLLKSLHSTKADLKLKVTFLTRPPAHPGLPATACCKFEQERAAPVHARMHIPQRNLEGFTPQHSSLPYMDHYVQWPFCSSLVRGQPLWSPILSCHGSLEGALASGLSSYTSTVATSNPSSLVSPPSDACGLRLGVRGLGVAGHSSVTQARDTLNLGVVAHYHPFFNSGVWKHRGFLPSGRDRGLPSMVPILKLNGVLTLLNWYISLLIPLLLKRRIKQYGCDWTASSWLHTFIFWAKKKKKKGAWMCASNWIKSTDFHSKYAKNSSWTWKQTDDVQISSLFWSEVELSQFDPHWQVETKRAN